MYKLQSLHSVFFIRLRPKSSGKFIYFGMPDFNSIYMYELFEKISKFIRKSLNKSWKQEYILFL